MFVFIWIVNVHGYRCIYLDMHVDTAKKLDTAIDYSDINEVADDEDVKRYRQALATMKPPKQGTISSTHPLDGKTSTFCP